VNSDAACSNEFVHIQSASRTPRDENEMDFINCEGAREPARRALVESVPLPAQDIEVTCRNPNNARAASVYLYSPDYPDKLQIEVKERGTTTAFSISQVGNYVIASVQWA
jgi:hypothetical protein